MDAAGDTALDRRLDDLLRATTSIVERLDLEVVLGRIVESAMALSGARYGALGILDDHGGLARFVHRGIPDEQARLIGPPPRGHGILGAVIAASEPVRLRDLAADPRSTGFPAHHPPMHSFLGVPVRVGDEVYGDLYLAEAPDGAFTAADERLITSLAAVAGVAVENARLYDRARIRTEWNAALADVMGALLDASGDDAIDLIVDRMTPLVHADLVTLAVPTGSGMRIVAARGTGAAALIGREHPREGSAADRALTTRRAVSSPDQPAGALFRDQPAWGPSVTVPLLAGDEPLGALTVMRDPGRPAFTDAELEMAFVFAGQAGVAIEVVRARDDRRRLELAGDRSRIARDLHDHVIQRLFGAGLSLQALSSRVAPDAAAEIATQIDALDAAIKEIRTVIFAIGDGGRGGVRERLLAVTGEAARQLPRSPRVSFSGPVDTLIAGDLADDLAAVLRESLANVIKHAAAMLVEVEVHADDDSVTLRVRDDGRGIPRGIPRSGLANLEQRARLRGGTLRVDSSDAGTRLEWRAPLAREESA